MQRCMNCSCLYTHHRIDCVSALSVSRYRERWRRENRPTFEKCLSAIIALGVSADFAILVQFAHRQIGIRFQPFLDDMTDHVAPRHTELAGDG